MLKPIFAIALLFFVCVPLAAAQITLGGNGTVTLINPDNNTFVFDSDNQTTYSYVGNSQDGWWFFMGGPGVEDSNIDLWIVALLFAVALSSVAIAFTLMKKRKQTNV